MIEQTTDVIIDEINVKKVEFVTDDSGIVKKSAKPNFKTLGPKHGKMVQPIASAVRNFSSKEISELERSGEITLTLNGTAVKVEREDVEVLHEDITGWLVESDGVVTVALDTELTDELVNEGFAREFVNRVQNMRKDAGFEVTDRIRIFFQANERLGQALRNLSSYVTNETLAVDLSESPEAGGYQATWDINGESCTIGIERVTSNGKKK